jgi:hypothetical protein
MQVLLIRRRLGKTRIVFEYFTAGDVGSLTMPASSMRWNWPAKGDVRSRKTAGPVPISDTGIEAPSCIDKPLSAVRQNADMTASPKRSRSPH